VPPYVRLQLPVVDVAAFPLLVSTRLHTSLGAVYVQLVTDACTCAVDVKVPNRPKTKPAMAIAAMRVMAMRMTVASTGEMAYMPSF